MYNGCVCKFAAFLYMDLLKERPKIFQDLKLLRKKKNGYKNDFEQQKNWTEYFWTQICVAHSRD